MLVNNAGVAGGAGRDLLADYDEEQWYRTVDVNLNAVYLVTKAFLPGMVARDGGAIVNISSIAGRAGQLRMGAYVATKFAIIGLTQQLALEYAPAVRVNCICPGTVDTEEMDRTFARRDALAGTSSGTAKEKRIAALPIKRQGRPEDTGKAAVFLASDAADWVTGHDHQRRRSPGDGLSGAPRRADVDDDLWRHDGEQIVIARHAGDQLASAGPGRPLQAGEVRCGGALCLRLDFLR